MFRRLLLCDKEATEWIVCCIVLRYVPKFVSKALYLSFCDGFSMCRIKKMKENLNETKAMA